MVEHSNKGIFFSYTTLCILDNSITHHRHPPYRLKGNHTAYGDVLRLYVGVFFSVHSLCCVYSNAGTLPKIRLAGGAAPCGRSVPEPRTPEPAMHFMLANAHTDAAPLPARDGAEPCCSAHKHRALKGAFPLAGWRSKGIDSSSLGSTTSCMLV